MLETIGLQRYPNECVSVWLTQMESNRTRLSLKRKLAKLSLTNFQSTPSPANWSITSWRMKVGRSCLRRGEHKVRFINSNLTCRKWKMSRKQNCLRTWFSDLTNNPKLTIYSNEFQQPLKRTSHTIMVQELLTSLIQPPRAIESSLLRSLWRSESMI
jgi:hypothetical protein